MHGISGEICKSMEIFPKNFLSCVGIFGWILWRKNLARAVAVGPIDAYAGVVVHFHGIFLVLFCSFTHLVLLKKLTNRAKLSDDNFKDFYSSFFYLWADAWPYCLTLIFWLFCWEVGGPKIRSSKVMTIAKLLGLTKDILYVEEFSHNYKFKWNYKKFSEVKYYDLTIKRFILTK